jgi:hypothetical protein
VRAGLAESRTSAHVEAYQAGAVLSARVIRGSGEHQRHLPDDTSCFTSGLGIADKLETKIMPRGSQSAALVRVRGRQQSFRPADQRALSVPRLDFVGPIPADLQLIQTFAAAIVAGSKERWSASRQLIAFSPHSRTAAAIRNNGWSRIEKR